MNNYLKIASRQQKLQNRWMKNKQYCLCWQLNGKAFFEWFIAWLVKFSLICRRLWITEFELISCWFWFSRCVFFLLSEIFLIENNKLFLILSLSRYNCILHARSGATRNSFKEIRRNIQTMEHFASISNYCQPFSSEE